MKLSSTEGHAKLSFYHPDHNRYTQLHTNPSFSTTPLLLPKPNSLLHSPQQLLLQYLIAFIRRQIQPVETSMRLRQLSLLSGLLNREASRPIRALQVLETVDGDTRSTGGELQQPRLLLGVPAAYALFQNMLVSAVAGWCIGEGGSGGLTFQKFCTTTSLSVYPR